MPLLGDINSFSDSDYYSVDLSYFSKPHDLISSIKDPVRRNAGRREIMDADMEFKASGTKRQRTDPLDGANSLSKLAKVYDKRVQETMTVKGLSKQKEDDGNCIITQIGDTVKAPEGIVKNEYKQAPMLTLNQLLPERFKPRGGERAASKLQSSFRTEKVEFVLFFSSGVPQRLDGGDLGRPTRYCYLESIYHAWDGGTDHRASLVSHPTQCVAVLGGLH